MHDEELERDLAQASKMPATIVKGKECDGSQAYDSICATIHSRNALDAQLELAQGAKVLLEGKKVTEFKKEYHFTILELEARKIKIDEFITELKARIASHDLAIQEYKANLVPKLTQLIKDCRDMISAAGPIITEADVRQFYDQFSKAYASRDPAKILNLVSSRWSSSSGVTFSQLQSDLQNTFNQYREGLTCSISGLSLTPSEDAPPAWKVRYHMAIKGQQFVPKLGRSILNTEEYDVSDTVGLENGALRVLSTESGGDD